MSEEKKSLSRRSFLKGATTAGVVAAVSGGGLFVQKLEAQGRKAMKRASVKEPPGVKEDKDVEPLANNLAETSIQGAYDAFNAASEDFVKGKGRRMDSKALLAKHGIILKSPEARGAAKSFNAPPSVLKAREQQLKQKGWHSHCSGCFLVLCWHWHVSW
ncbi:MAG: twin-arginine translocation signal domain-containing protein [Candidatus Aminicenantes bacterium]|nr:twin-arginine translocation signal domain-containing protein [Candidatus Aminicenantes bacterium]NIM83723.1 twin-arginine translocation signal domain-containing protein [Candidatus Aminicenantes bacterium]NIN23148.1 twin-arginine translocation signal domain-containing protein [Candidatus Aminicenantes bacterium]NIN46875.1 twin-arginine translocation signal domain-containing protein [Candidatus Aminicenantes bacterium]NIN89797.1 twin-arginine translocation signal domain-containing protein [Ca